MLVNYNGYGGSVEDLLYHPADLYGELAPFKSPMGFLCENKAVFEKLDAGYETDLAKAKQAKVIDKSEVGHVITLADSAGSRRISGVYGNQLAQDNPARAHAILTAQEASNPFVRFLSHLSKMAMGCCGLTSLVWVRAKVIFLIRILRLIAKIFAWPQISCVRTIERLAL